VPILVNGSLPFGIRMLMPRIVQSVMPCTVGFSQHLSVGYCQQTSSLLSSECQPIGRRRIVRLQFGVAAVLAFATVETLPAVAQGRLERKPESDQPTYVMIVVFENDNGKKTIEQVPVPESTCFFSIRKYQEIGPFNLKVHSSDRSGALVNGRAVEIHCVSPAGNWVGTHPSTIVPKP
jgi:hypothetical protein